MHILQVLHQYWPAAAGQTIAEIDAEIREELEFHLAMRTQDNLQAGMPPEEASRAAQRRFGDFEANRRACRRITVGPRLLFQRLQVGLLGILLAAVVYQAVLLFQLQTTSRDQIAALTHLVEQLQANREPARKDAATIPFVRWDLDSSQEFVAANHNLQADELADWNAKAQALQQPWSDWLPLGDPPADD